MPSAWSAVTPLIVRARLASDVAGYPEGGAPRLTEVRVVPPRGLEIGESGDQFRAGTDLVAQDDGSTVPAVGRYDVVLVTSRAALPAPAETADASIARAAEAGAAYEIERVRVR